MPSRNSDKELNLLHHDSLESDREGFDATKPGYSRGYEDESSDMPDWFIGCCGGTPNRFHMWWSRKKKEPRTRLTMEVTDWIIFLIKMGWAVYVSLKMNGYYNELQDVRAQLASTQTELSTTTFAAFQLGGQVIQLNSSMLLVESQFSDTLSNLNQSIIDVAEELDQFQNTTIEIELAELRAQVALDKQLFQSMSNNLSFALSESAQLYLEMNQERLAMNDSVNSFAARVSALSGSIVTRVVVRVFNTSQIYVPSPGMKYCIVKVFGGGGGGGGSNSGAGGGAGGYAEGIFNSTDISDMSPINLTIGVGGPGGLGGSGTAGYGFPGGNSSFGLHLNATGGAGGGESTTGTVGVGGQGYGGYLQARGNSGDHYLNWGSTINGRGGSSIFGDGGRGMINGAPGENGPTYSSGGSGSAATNPGGNGAPGLIIIQEFC